MANDWGQWSNNPLGGAIQAAANVAASRYRPKPQKSVGGPGSDMDLLMRQLMSSLGQGYSAPSESSLELQARQSANMQFDPQIAAINRAMARARQNAAYSGTAIGKLFQGLAESYKGDKKDTKQIFKNAKEEEKARLNDYTEATKANYQDSMNSLTESFKKLGIEAAAGDSTTGALAKDEAFNLQRATTDSATEQQALNTQQTGDLSYWEKGMGTAQMEGTQRRADLQMALSQYLQDQGSNLEDLKAQEEITYQNNLARLQQEVQQQAAQQSNETWSRLMQLGRFQMDVNKYNQSMANAGNKSFGKGLTGASNYLYEQFRNSQWGPGEGERYNSVLQGIILSLPPGITPEQAASTAAEEANRRGLSASVMSRAMLAYYGRA
jgi:hypothetical protein